MSFKTTWYQDKFRKKVKKGFSGYPVATIAYYGPDNLRATKVVVAIIHTEGAEPTVLERWYSDSHDVRADPTILKAVLDFISNHAVKSVVAVDGLLGCPHEEGKDYPDGETCPQCTFWANRDRFTGNVVH